MVNQVTNSNYITNELVDTLKSICGDGVHLNVDLSSHSLWKIGGYADCLLEPSSILELSKIIELFNSVDIPYIVFGSTSNLLFSDAGIRVPCIHIGARMSNVVLSKDLVHVQAGAWVPLLARNIMQAGLTGAEHICGIPGTIGGLICMNGGSQRQCIGDSILEVTSIDPYGNLIIRDNKSCKFSYRESIYKNNKEIITSVKLRFNKGNKADIRSKMLSILSERRQKFPKNLPNCGSVFKSNPEMYSNIGPPGKIIEELGFKGILRGGARVSNLHSNFIINENSATAEDVISLINEIKDTVYNKTGYTMEVEARYINEEGNFLAL